MCKYYRINSPFFQLLAYVDNINIVGETIDTIKKNKETLLDASKELVAKGIKRKLSIC
jgi:hypothetical protein